MTNTLKQLAAAGTSPWLDNIRRGWLVSGEFRRMVDEGIVGVTSNPTIFQKAIAGSSDYDSAVASMQSRGESPADVFFELAIEDVREAADQIRHVYDESGHLDGFVSFELPPAMANDTQASIAGAPEFFERIGRPNIFIKIPGTAAGAPAIEESIAAGINVNVTLLFALQSYEDIHMAYIRGLERRVAAGQPIDDLHSWRASSSAGSTRPSTPSCRGTRLCAARRPSRTRSSPTSASGRSRRRIAGRRLRPRARRCSGRCGRRPARRTRPTRTCSTWTS